MQRTPIKLEPFLLGAYQKISAINGVVQYKEPHFWTLSGNDWFGTLTLVIRRDADDQETRMAAESVLREIGVNKITIQVERF
jgi:Co/Zn/Cd efflux system component